MKKFLIITAIIIALLALIACNEPEAADETSALPETAEGEGTLGEETGELYTVPDETAAEETSAEPDMPTFSADGGAYDSAFELTLSTDTQYKIRYNLGSDVPTKKSQEYKSPIKLEKGVTVVRAALFDGKGNIVGAVATNTYLIGESKIGGVYTVAISANKSDYDKICKHFSESLEVPAHVEILTPDGQRVISQDAGLKIFGGSSRSLPQKSLKLNARKTEKLAEKFSTAIYSGKGSFGYAFFEGRTVRSGKDAGQTLDKYDSLILRNGGNDSIQSSAAAEDRPCLLRDNIANNFAAGVCESLDYASSTFAVVYVNGEYYGLLDMKENMNDDYVGRMYGLDSDQVAILKSELDTTRGGRFDGSWFFYECDDGSRIDEFEKLCRKAIKSIGAKNYDSVYTEISEKIDAKSFMEYVALNLYVCNTDWPHNNVKIWRYTGDPVEGIAQSDGKWRFMTRDMDMAFARYDCPDILPELNNLADVDTFYRILGNYVDYHGEYSYEGEYQLYPDSLGLQGLFAFFMENAGFRAEFEAFCRKLCSDESTARLTELTEQATSDVKAKIADVLERWKGTYPGSYNKNVWTRAAKNIKSFVNDRRTYFIKYLEKALAKYQ